MAKRTVKLSCPICKKTVTTANPEFPFCSGRCRTIDLGKWASGQYVISSPVRDIEDEFQSEAQTNDSDDE